MGSSGKSMSDSPSQSVSMPSFWPSPSESTLFGRQTPSKSFTPSQSWSEKSMNPSPSSSLMTHSQNSRSQASSQSQSRQSMWPLSSLSRSFGQHTMSPSATPSQSKSVA